MPTRRPPFISFIFKSFAPILCAGALALGPADAAAQAFDESFVIRERSLRVLSLIGTVTVEGHSGTDFEIEVHVRGKDASRERIQIEETGGSPRILAVRFPLKESRQYVYPELGNRSSSSFSWNPDQGPGSVSLKDLLGLGKSRNITVKGSGDGLEIWADLVVRVPKGATLRAQAGCGTLVATGVEGDLLLDISAGAIRAEGVTGDLSADSGSGSVQITSAKGKVIADTGSGSIHIEDVQGNLSADTGSGRITLARIHGDRIVADTGSGSVHLEDIDCDDLQVDTGSGDIDVSAASIGSGTFDTGSGGVDLALARLRGGSIQVDTGSGSVDLILPASPSVTVRAESSSGGVDVDLDGVEWLEKTRTEKSFRVGGGDTRIVVETGSGSIRVRS